MPRRPFLLLSLVLLAGAAVQAVFAAVTRDDSVADQPGEVCTACGPLVGD